MSEEERAVIFELLEENRQQQRKFMWWTIIGDLDEETAIYAIDDLKQQEEYMMTELTK